MVNSKFSIDKIFPISESRYLIVKKKNHLSYDRLNLEHKYYDSLNSLLEIQNRFSKIVPQNTEAVVDFRYCLCSSEEHKNKFIYNIEGTALIPKKK